MPPEMVDRFWQEACAQPVGQSVRAIYLHFPFCKKRCAFCPFFINRYHRDKMQQYVEALCREIELTGNQDGMQSKSIRAIYFGGGTPSDLPVEAVRQILDGLRHNFPLAEHCEITMEGRVFGSSEELAEEWVAAGVNRISLGVQCFDTDRRRQLGRIEDRERVLQVLHELTNVNGCTVNIDLLYGLPGQTVADFLADIETVIDETHLHGFDIYALKTFAKSPLEEAVSAGQLPPPPGLKGKSEYYLRACELLAGSAFWQISTCHWVRDPQERSVYNRLAKAGEEIIPIGSGAGGRLDTLSLFQHNVLDSYLRDVANGRKPIAFAGPRRPSEKLKDAFCDELELGRLRQPTLDRLAKAAPSTRRQVKRWETMGLLTSINYQDEAYELTPTGRYWTPTMLEHTCRHLGLPAHGI